MDSYPLPRPAEPVPALHVPHPQPVPADPQPQFDLGTMFDSPRIVSGPTSLIPECTMHLPQLIIHSIDATSTPPRVDLEFHPLRLFFTNRTVGDPLVFAGDTNIIRSIVATGIVLESISSRREHFRTYQDSGVNRD